jgi:hypothetical protein
MMKSLVTLENELRKLLNFVESQRGEVLPSRQDEIINSIRHLCSDVLGTGGAQRVLQLVQDARARGES